MRREPRLGGARDAALLLLRHRLERVAVARADASPSLRRSAAACRGARSGRPRCRRPTRSRRECASRACGTTTPRGARPDSPIAESLERQPVHGARTAFAHDGGVRRRDVADVLCEPVRRIERIEPAHQPVACHLRDDRRRRDRRALRVAVDDGGVLGRGRPEPEAVDETGLGRRRERAAASRAAPRGSTCAGRCGRCRRAGSRAPRPSRRSRAPRGRAPRAAPRCTASSR